MNTSPWSAYASAVVSVGVGINFSHSVYSPLEVHPAVLRDVSEIQLRLNQTGQLLLHTVWHSELPILFYTGSHPVVGA